VAEETILSGIGNLTKRRTIQALFRTTPGVLIRIFLAHRRLVVLVIGQTNILRMILRRTSFGTNYLTVVQALALLMMESRGRLDCFFQGAAEVGKTNPTERIVGRTIAIVPATRERQDSICPRS
jgi:hypothetical protein